MIKHEDALKTIGEVSSIINIPVYVMGFGKPNSRISNP